MFMCIFCLWSSCICVECLHYVYNKIHTNVIAQNIKRVKTVKNKNTTPIIEIQPAKTKSQVPINDKHIKTVTSTLALSHCPPSQEQTSYKLFLPHTYVSAPESIRLRSRLFSVHHAY